jgi:hypothetical protein
MVGVGVATTVGVAVGVAITVGVAVAVAVGLTVAVAVGATVGVVAVAVGVAMTVGVVTGCVTVAVELVMVTVMVTVPVLTVIVVGLATGAAIWLTVVVLPAMVTAAGVMLFVTMAAWAAVVLPVMAAMPVIVLDTFANLVPPFSHHRCSAPLADLTSRNFLVARTTMPRCAANCVWWRMTWLNVRIGCICASVLNDFCCDEPQVLSAEARAVCSLILWLKWSVNPADEAALVLGL